MELCRSEVLSRGGKGEGGLSRTQLAQRQYAHVFTFVSRWKISQVVYGCRKVSGHQPSSSRLACTPTDRDN